MPQEAYNKKINIITENDTLKEHPNGLYAVTGIIEKATISKNSSNHYIFLSDCKVQSEITEPESIKKEVEDEEDDRKYVANKSSMFCSECGSMMTKTNDKMSCGSCGNTSRKLPDEEWVTSTDQGYFSEQPIRAIECPYCGSSEHKIERQKLSGKVRTIKICDGCGKKITHIS
jgi:ribosomal protein S27AE